MLPPSTNSVVRGCVLTLYMLRPSADFQKTTSRFLADILFVYHFLTSQCSLVFVTPCDFSYAQPFQDESRKDLPSIHCNKKF